ncbi:MAG: hypothetical protein ACE5I1_25405 [bacterium]
MYHLTYFFDEILGHILWDSGLILITLALIIRAFNEKLPSSDKNIPLLAVSSVFFGFTYFCNAVEGQTVVFMLPVSILLPVIIAVALRRVKQKKNAITLYFIGAYSFACILFIIWGIWQNGFPQFSEIGWI